MAARKATIIETGKTRTGFSLRLQKRGESYDVVYCTGFCWKYVDGAKAVSEAAARNVFFIQQL